MWLKGQDSKDSKDKNGRGESRVLIRGRRVIRYSQIISPLILWTGGHCTYLFDTVFWTGFKKTVFAYWGCCLIIFKYVKCHFILKCAFHLSWLKYFVNQSYGFLKDYNVLLVQKIDFLFPAKIFAGFFLFVEEVW